MFYLNAVNDGSMERAADALWSIKSVQIELEKRQDGDVIFCVKLCGADMLHYSYII